jgi:hypothetical protein
MGQTATLIEFTGRSTSESPHTAVPRKEAEYAFKRLSMFRGKVFVYNGRDMQTGAYPIRTYLGDFVSEARSVLQCIGKEMRQAGRWAEYETLVASHPVFGFFKKIRDSNVHDYVPSIHTTISATVQLTRLNGRDARLGESMRPDPGPEDHPTEATVKTTLGRRVEPTAELLDAAKRGEELYEELELDGESDMHVLCERYLAELKQFAADCAAQGLIT